MGLVLHHHGDNDINGWQNKAYATYECYKVEKNKRRKKGKKNFDHRLQASVNQLTLTRGA